ncbi:ABC transporter ATP-binding protein [Sulfurihydrogenibium yellowstonense]|uniref:ABC transporter ATP-binding protein n=1 Tax=Sulfurihydrogenibium yellowstonense TaxID=304736 RepID=UPI001E5C6848|nr:ABC transporter ATP-binding protein [Sulfurihydrogenibium yellowstonense]
MYENFKKYKLLLFLALIGSIVEAGALAGLTFIVKDVIDEVFIEKDLNKLKLIILVLLLLVIIKQIGFIFKEYMYPLALYKVMKNLRENIFKKILNADMSFFFGKQYGEILSRATNDIEAFKSAMILIGVDFFTQLFTVIAMVGVLIYRDWKLFLIFLFATPLFAISFNYFGEKRKKYSQRVQESAGEYTQFINQLLYGLETIKLFSKEKILSVFESINERFFKNQRKNALYDVFFLSSIEIASYLAAGGIIFYGGVRIINGELTTGDLFSFLSALLILVNSSQILQRGLIQIKAVNPVIERIKFLLDMPQEKEDGIEFKGLKEKIEYKNVSLKINENKILEDVNVLIRKGQKVGIIGQTGSGKSSFVKLLYGVFRNYEGKILLDDVDLKEYNIKTVRDKIAVITQDVFIFNDTIENNLKIAKPDATEEEIINALKKAKADFVFRLKDTVKTAIGERGSSLSGGERQRLAIARIFLKNPDIIIIDEGTSALDEETEKYVMEEIYSHFHDKTILIIAHRLKTLEKCDMFIVFENGKVKEIRDSLNAKDSTRS